MEWKRCSKCGNLKRIDNFWKQGDKRRSACSKCLTEQVDKNKKKKYDKNRYLKNKKKIAKEEPICSKCQNRFANVKNNQIYWCFNCLLKYEKEYERKIPVEIIDIRRRKYVQLIKEKNKEESHLLNSFKKILLQFIEKIEHKNIIDEKLKYEILQLSVLWNKQEVIEDMIKKIKVFKDYDEKEVNFPYKYYLQVLLDKKKGKE